MKLCSKCNNAKEFSSFYIRKSGPRAGEYYEKCKECMKFRGRNYYHANRERQLPLALERRNKARRLKRQFINTLKNKPCADCGNFYPPYVMDFDHRDDKIADIAYLTTRNWSLEKIKKEAEKCDIICANCHRIRTFANKPR